MFSSLYTEVTQPNASDVNNNLRYACRHGHINEVKNLLIEEGVDVNDKDHEQFTALHRAAQKGYTDICRLLLDNGANVDDRNNKGNTPLMLASSENHVDVTNLLLERGSDRTIRGNFKNYTALDYAKSQKRLSIVRILEKAEEGET